MDQEKLIKKIREKQDELNDLVGELKNFSNKKVKIRYVKNIGEQQNLLCGFINKDKKDCVIGSHAFYLLSEKDLEKFLLSSDSEINLFYGFNHAFKEIGCEIIAIKDLSNRACIKLRKLK